MYPVSQPSPYDFFFHIGPIPVRVSWAHWISGALIGWDSLYYLDPTGSPQPIFLLLWLAVFFVSILVHELGHAFMARLFGYQPDVSLVFLGGYARYQPGRNYSYGREVLITLAGPGAGFLLFVAAQVVVQTLPLWIGTIDNDLLQNSIIFTATRLAFVNLFWTILNLLPVLPLDGGRVSDVVCRVFSPDRGPFISRWISVVVGGLLALVGFRFNLPMMGIIFFLLAAQNFQEIQANR